MERQRQIKILSIIALVVAIVGMSLGFAAFSATLNISSSASVTPNSDDFNVILCDQPGIGACSLGGYVYFVNGQSYGGAINDDNVSGVMGQEMAVAMEFSGTNQKMVYTVFVQNVGEYDAYLRSITFTALSNGEYKKCTALSSDTSDNLVQEACDGIRTTISIGGAYYDIGETNISGHLLEKNTSEELVLTVEYLDGSTLADGPFNVSFAGLKLNYSTLDYKATTNKKPPSPTPH